MLAVHGSLLFCGGFVFFFLMLHLHRRPGIAHWLETRAVGEITVFASMMVSLYGIAMVGRFGVQLDEQTFGTAEGLEIVGIFLVAGIAIWRLYIRTPEEKLPAPAEGKGPTASATSIKKAA